MLKIVHVIPDLNIISGGPVSAVISMAREQVAKGHQVDILATNDGFNPNTIPAAIHYDLSHCNFKPWRWSSELKMKFIPFLKRADIVHLHGFWEYPIFAAMQICHRLEKPYILRPCGMLDNWSLMQKKLKKKIYLNILGNRIIRYASAIHFTTLQEKLNSLALCKQSQNFVCGLGVDLDFWKALPPKNLFRENFPQLGEDKIILFLGRIHYKKQPDLLIRAFSKILIDHPNTHLVFAGTGEVDYINQLKKTIKNLSIEKKILFAGMLVGASKKAAFAAAEVFVLPSLQENFGIAAVEAMAAGCPIVISDQVNLVSEVLKAQAGLQCLLSSESIAKAVDKLLKDEVLRRRMGENGKKLVYEKFTWGNAVEALTEQYLRVLKNNSKEIETACISGAVKRG